VARHDKSFAPGSSWVAAPLNQALHARIGPAGTHSERMRLRTGFLRLWPAKAEPVLLRLFRYRACTALHRTESGQRF